MKLPSLCLALALTACSNGIAPIPNTASAVAAHRASGGLTILISVPHPRKHARRPGFISPSTQAVTLAVTGPTPISETVALLPSAANCSSTTGTTSCTLSIAGLVPCTGSTNCYVASVTAYDAVSCSPACTIPGTAHKLSGAQAVAFGVVAGRANTLALVLGGIPASILVSPLKSGYVQGDAGGLKLWGPAVQKLIAVALDADGNVILGPGAPKISVSSGGANLAATDPAVAAPNVFTLRAPVTGSPPAVTPGVAQLHVLAVPAAQSGGSEISASIPVTVAHSAVYVTTDASILTYLDGNTAVASRAIAGSNPCLDGVNSIAVNANLTIFASSSNANQVCVFPDGFNGNATASASIAGAATGFNTPSGLALDSSGSLYVANLFEIAEFFPGSSGNVAPAATIVGSSTQIADVFYVTLDRTGTIYAANYYANSINAYAPFITGNVAPIAQLSGAATGLDGPSGMAIDANGRLHVADSGNASITEYASGASGNTPPLATISGASTSIINPKGVAIDAAGTLYVSDYGAVAILEFANGAHGNVTPTVTIPESTGPTAIAVVPPMH
jgi:hypothetical protein